jgi:hypothetical protein
MVRTAVADVLYGIARVAAFRDGFAAVTGGCTDWSR